MAPTIMTFAQVRDTLQVSDKTPQHDHDRPLRQICSGDREVREPKITSKSWRWSAMWAVGEVRRQDRQLPELDLEE